ncbi:MAG: hypothetical protein J6X53_08370, partial [Abditibacteriota bacterium]|nr:hypothetical protein [Abditibacteriota bacterium]
GYALPFAGVLFNALRICFAISLASSFALSRAWALMMVTTCYYKFAPCSWQPATGEGHLIA